MSSRLLGLVVLTGLAASGPASAQQLVNLPLGSWANDVTPDGEVVVGTYDYHDGFIWRWRVEAAPTVILGGDMVGVSDDGSVVCGNILDPGGSGNQVAGLWTAATGWQSLGSLPGTPALCGSMSSAYDISGDGTTVVGLAWASGCDGVGFRWTAAGGMQVLQPLADGGNRCSAISGDGTALGGFAQGTSARTPAYWAADTSGSVLDPNMLGEVWGFNESGSKSVGSRWFSGGTYSAYIRDSQSGVMTNLGKLTSTWAGIATDLSEDSSVIVGFDNLQLARKAWVWTSSDGMISLNNRLTALGVTAPPLLVCRAVSDDGSVVVGGGEAGAGGPFGIAGFIVELPSKSAQWTDLGGGLAGSAGLPALAVGGSLCGGDTLTFTISHGQPDAAALLIVGLAATPQPWKGGVLWPAPDVVVPALLGASGGAALTLHVPIGEPAGQPVIAQGWIADTGAPAGVSATPAVTAKTP